MTQSQELGRIPPQAIELEEAVLGACLLNANLINEVIDKLKPEIFYKQQHVTIWNAITDIYNSGKVPDLLTLHQKLKATNQIESVGVSYLSQLTNKGSYGSEVILMQNIDELLNQYMRRELIKISYETSYKAYDETIDVSDVISTTELELSRITDKVIKKDFSKVASIYRDFARSLDEKIRLRNQGIHTEIVSGFPQLDRLTGGLHKSDFIIIAARPSMGKTAFALTIARNVAVRFNRAVGIFSLEMSSEQLLTRIISMETHIPSSRIRDARLDPEDFAKMNKAGEFINCNLFIDDTAGITVTELRAKSRRMKAKHSIELIIVDYVQLIRVGSNAKKNQNREQDVSEISRSIKEIAKELNIPVIALSQISRAVESRAVKRPQLSDLRESGSLEQDADVVQFIHRPEYYNVMQDEKGNSTENLAEIITAKNRNGEIGDEVIYFDKPYTEFLPDIPGSMNNDLHVMQPVLNPNRQFESHRDDDVTPF